MTDPEARVEWYWWTDAAGRRRYRGFETVRGFWHILPATYAMPADVAATARRWEWQPSWRGEPPPRGLAADVVWLSGPRPRLGCHVAITAGLEPLSSHPAPKTNKHIKGQL